MKFAGDVPEKYKDLALDLEKMEADIDSNTKMSKEILAKCYTCLAHDWLQLHMEEETGRLLEKAEKVCPGYFENEMKIHIEQNKDFKKIAQNISILLLEIAMDRLKEAAK